jgi:pimeloyl-ACP methyl ester carboxylesterase
MKHMLIVLTILLSVNAGVWAQRDAAAEIVTVQAADGLMLVGEFYAASDDQPAPSLLLMHMLGGRRSAWQALVPALTDAGYNVLTIDLRGHGDTGGAQDWQAAERDVYTWLDWLSEQPSVLPDAFALVGGSIGSNLALIGCAYDLRCVTAVALSPGLDYRGVAVDQDVLDAMAERSLLLVAAQGDQYSADSVKILAGWSNGELGLQLYPGSAHGTNLVGTADAPAVNLILHWLQVYLSPA